jgi:DNA-binding NarL/FixJ family response regulator
MDTMPDRIRLLHVEDNADYRALMAATLRVDPNLHFILSSAASLKEALDFLNLEVFDVILLDWELPDASGSESIVAIREIDPNASIVIFTAHDSDAIVEAARNAGADAFLLKELSNVKNILTALHFAASRRARRDDRVITALEGMLEMLEDATGSLERHVTSEEHNGL